MGYLLSLIRVSQNPDAYPSGYTTTFHPTENRTIRVGDDFVAWVSDDGRVAKWDYVTVTHSMRMMLTTPLFTLIDRGVKLVRIRITNNPPGLQAYQRTGHPTENRLIKVGDEFDAILTSTGKKVTWTFSHNGEFEVRRLSIGDGCEIIPKRQKTKIKIIKGPRQPDNIWARTQHPVLKRTIAVGDVIEAEEIMPNGWAKWENHQGDTETIGPVYYDHYDIVVDSDESQVSTQETHQVETSKDSKMSAVVAGIAAVSIVVGFGLGYVLALSGDGQGEADPVMTQIDAAAQHIRYDLRECMRGVRSFDGKTELMPHYIMSQSMARLHEARLRIIADRARVIDCDCDCHQHNPIPAFVDAKTKK